MIQILRILLNQEEIGTFRLRNSEKFRKANFYKHFNYLQDNELLLEERNFQVEYLNEEKERHQTYSLIAIIMQWVFLLIALYYVLNEDYISTIIAICIGLVFYYIARKQHTNYILTNWYNQNLNIPYYNSLINTRFNLKL